MLYCYLFLACDPSVLFNSEKSAPCSHCVYLINLICVLRQVLEEVPIDRKPAQEWLTQWNTVGVEWTLPAYCCEEFPFLVVLNFISVKLWAFRLWTASSSTNVCLSQDKSWGLWQYCCTSTNNCGGGLGNL